MTKKLYGFTFVQNLFGQHLQIIIKVIHSDYSDYSEYSDS